MLSSRSRIALGCILAVAVGTFGPISRAVSMESRRLVDERVPAGSPIGPYVGEMDAGYGLVGTYERRIGAQYYREELRVEDRYVVREDHHFGETRIVLDEWDHVILLSEVCTSYRSGCTRRTWTGLGELEVHATQHRYTGTLVAPDGSTCATTASWDRGALPGGTNLSVQAAGRAETSCVGRFAWDARQGDIYTIARGH